MKSAEDRNTALEKAKAHTKYSLKRLWIIVKKYGNGKSRRSSAFHKNISKFHYENRFLLKALRMVPYLLGSLFLISFFWDFNGLSFHVFDRTFLFEGLLRIISVSGLIGFGTNWLAITMLFKPVKKRPLLGRGLIPAQKERIAFRLAQAVSEDLINPQIIKEKLHEWNAINRYRKSSTRYIKTIIDDPAFRADLKFWAAQYVDDMIANPEIRAAMAEKILIQIDKSIKKTSIEKAALRTYSFIKGQKMQQIIEEALTKLPEAVEDGLDRFDIFLDKLPAQLEKHSTNIEQIITSVLHSLINQLDIHYFVEDTLRQYDEQRVADLIKNAVNEQLQYIQYLGGILGVVGGLLIWEPLYSLIMLVSIVLFIFTLDTLFNSFKK